MARSDDNYNNLNEYSKYKRPNYIERSSKKRPASYSIANLKSTEKMNLNQKEHILANFDKNNQEAADKRVTICSCFISRQSRIFLHT